MKHSILETTSSSWLILFEIEFSVEVEKVKVGDFKGLFGVHINLEH